MEYETFKEALAAKESVVIFCCLFLWGDEISVQLIGIVILEGLLIDCSVEPGKGA